MPTLPPHRLDQARAPRSVTASPRHGKASLRISPSVPRSSPAVAQASASNQPAPRPAPDRRRGLIRSRPSSAPGGQHATSAPPHANLPRRQHDQPHTLAAAIEATVERLSGINVAHHERGRSRTADHVLGSDPGMAERRMRGRPAQRLPPAQGRAPARGRALGLRACGEASLRLDPPVVLAAPYARIRAGRDRAAGPGPGSKQARRSRASRGVSPRAASSTRGIVHDIFQPGPRHNDQVRAPRLARQGFVIERRHRHDGA